MASPPRACRARANARQLSSSASTCASRATSVVAAAWQATQSPKRGTSEPRSTRPSRHGRQLEAGPPSQQGSVQSATTT